MADSCTHQKPRQAGAVTNSVKDQLNDKLIFEPSTKRPYRLTFLLLVFIAMTPLFVLAADPAPPSAAIVAKNPELFAWAFGVGLLALCSLLGYIVYTNHENNKMQWQEIKDVGKRMTAIEIKCASNHGKG